MPPAHKVNPPSMQAKPDPSVVGSKVTISGANFIPGEPLSVVATFPSGQSDTRKTTADSKGAWAVRFTAYEAGGNEARAYQASGNYFYLPFTTN